jgi:hypothetical protein
LHIDVGKSSLSVLICTFGLLASADDFELDIVGVSAGKLDAGGIPQPSYLNIEACRMKLHPPSGYLQVGPVL